MEEMTERRGRRGGVTKRRERELKDDKARKVKGWREREGRDDDRCQKHKNYRRAKIKPIIPIIRPAAANCAVSAELCKEKGLLWPPL